MDMQHWHQAEHHAACPYPYCTSMSMTYGQVFAGCPSLYCVSMSMLHVHVHTSSPFLCCMSMSMLYAHVHATCPCQCCMFKHMRHCQSLPWDGLQWWLAESWEFRQWKSAYLFSPQICNFLVSLLISHISRIGIWTSANANPLTICICMYMYTYINI